MAMKTNSGIISSLPRSWEVRRYSGRQEPAQGCTSATASVARSRVVVVVPSVPRQDDAVQALAVACQDPLDEDQDPPLHPCVEGLAYIDGACWVCLFP